MSKLSKITQRSSVGVIRNSSKTLNSAQWASVLDNLSNDLGQLISEHNNKIKPILDGLTKGSDDEITGLSDTYDAISKGLDGTVQFTDRDSSDSDPEYIFSEILNRPLTIKESLVELYQGLIEKIDSLIINSDGVSDYTKAYIGERAFDSTVSSSATSIDGKLTDAISRLTVTEATIDAISLDVEDIKSFIGMSDSESLPVYSDYGSLTNIEDGDSLEEALWKLDQAIGSSLPDFTNGHILFGDGSNIPTEDLDLFFDSTNTRLGVGTSSPEQTLDIRGIIQHNNGVISRGGNVRGVGASDLQVTRANVTQVASGLRSFIGAGQNNTALGADSAAFGSGCTAQGLSSLAAGISSNAAGNYSFALGESCLANGRSSFAFGERASASLRGQTAQASGRFADDGDAQFSRVTMRNSTNGNVTVELFIDGALERLILKDNSSYSVKMSIIGRALTGETNHYSFVCTYERGVGAGTTTLMGGYVKSVIDEDAPGADANIGADIVNGSILLQVTGVPNIQFRWVASVELVEVRY